MIELAIVGFGRWGKVLVDSVQGKSDRVRFRTAVSRHPNRIMAEATARAMDVRDSLEAVLADPSIDGIVLATPHSRHADEIVACAAADKAVFVEKPFTLTRASAERALQAARSAGITVAAGHNRRFLPAVMAIRRMIDAGELGELLHIESNFSTNVAGRYAAGMWRVAEGESPAGGLAGLGIHMIDAIIHLAGGVVAVAATSARRVLDVPLDDTTAVLLRLAGGASASLTTITATAPTFRLQVFGTKGSAELRGQRDVEVVTVAGDRRQTVFDAVDIERAELEAFADAIAGRADYPVPLDEVLNGVAAFEAVSLAIARDGWVRIA